MRNPNRPAKYQRHAPLAAGQKFNRMTLIESRASEGRLYHWLCRCDCGTEKVVNAFDVRRGRVQSCGCALLNHGQYGSSLYARYQVLAHHKAQGMVCETWNSFERFAADMGDGHFEGAKLDRTDLELPYSKANCFWSTKEAYFARRRTTSWRGQAICEHCGATFERRVNGQRFCCKAHAAAWVAAHRKPARRACLTEAEVAEIRAAIEAGPRGTASAMARKYGVVTSVICRIKDGSYRGRQHV